MKNVLVTGSNGFLGKNLVVALRRRDDVRLITYDVDDERIVLEEALREAEVIFHLAGVNRPKREEEFKEGNVDLTKEIIEQIVGLGRLPVIVFSSTIQADRNNAYGKSKRLAEELLYKFNDHTGCPICIYRLPNLFGKWSRPNYNTVVATFCHNIARGLDISLSEPDHELELAYADDVVGAFMRHIDETPDPRQRRYSIERTFRVTLGALAEKIRKLRDIRSSLQIPDLSDPFTVCLHATYLSFLPDEEFAYAVKLHSDDRGWLFELIKSQHFGQIFVSKTLPGITRGNHYHDTKLEKFCVIQGQGKIRFRQVESEVVLEYPVTGEEINVVDIPPGYTHSIENTGDIEMICLFWANQVFDPSNPDTYFCEVLQ